MGRCRSEISTFGDGSHTKHFLYVLSVVHCVHFPNRSVADVVGETRLRPSDGPCSEAFTVC